MGGGRERGRREAEDRRRTLAEIARRERAEICGFLPVGGGEGELHFVEPVVGVHQLQQRPDLGVLWDGRIGVR